MLSIELSGFARPMAIGLNEIPLDHILAACLILLLQLLRISYNVSVYSTINTVSPLNLMQLLWKIQ